MTETIAAPPGSEATTDGATPSHSSLWALALGSIGVVTNLFALTSVATQAQPAGAIVIGLVLSLGSLALLIWFIVAATRFGPWAMRRP